MSTKTTMRILRIVGIILPVFGMLGATTRQTAFYVLATVSAFIGLGLMGYAWFREHTRGDKSPGVSPRASVFMFSLVGLWIAFVIIRAVTH